MSYKDLKRTAQDILGESDGHVVLPPHDARMNQPAFRERPRTPGIEVTVKNNARNPLTDIMTRLPRYTSPGKGPTMRSVGLEGNILPSKAVHSDGELLGSIDRIPHDDRLLSHNCMPSDNQLFGHMHGGRCNQPKGPRAPRVGRSRRN